MRKVLKIDDNGYFIEDVILENEEITPEGCIEVECPQGFYKPRWDGSRWIEGLTQEEIEELKKIGMTPQEPSLEERLAALEALMMGVI